MGRSILTLYQGGTESKVDCSLGCQSDTKHLGIYRGQLNIAEKLSNISHWKMNITNQDYSLKEQ